MDNLINNVCIYIIQLAILLAGHAHAIYYEIVTIVSVLRHSYICMIVS